MSGPTCPRCRTSLRPGDRFCLVCGAEAGQDDPSGRRELRVGLSAGVSDRGLRSPRNEDALALRAIDATGAVACVVCDGVSATPRSGEAARAAAETGAGALSAALTRGSDGTAAARAGLHAAGDAVRGLADATRSGRAPSCTYVSASLRAGELAVGWVGDSRAYWIPSRGDSGDTEHARVLTVDDVPPAADPAGRRSRAITNWLGADRPRPTPHVATLRPAREGLVVVCTDGLWDYLSEPASLAAALPARAADDTLDTARHLVRRALLAGGRDNVTVVVLPVTQEVVS